MAGNNVRHRIYLSLSGDTRSDEEEIDGVISNIKSENKLLHFIISFQFSTSLELLKTQSMEKSLKNTFLFVEYQSWRLSGNRFLIFMKHKVNCIVSFA
jgi:hypothetical protein